MAARPSPRPTPPGGPGGPNARRPAPVPPGVFVIVALLIVMVVYLAVMSPPTKEIYYSEFRQLLDAGQLKQVTLVGDDRLTGEVKDAKSELATKLKLPAGGKFSTNLLPSNDRSQLAKEIEAKNENVQIDRQPDPNAWLYTFVLFFLPPLLLFGLLLFMFQSRIRDPMGNGFLSNYVKSPARKYEKNKSSKVTFGDVAGMEQAKSELQEVVEFLKEPQKFQRLGAQVPKGVLLVGPPGTGKTLLAKAVAGEANVPFYSINGSEFIQMFVGVGASRVRDLFKTAKENAPCLVFIDEIDAVGRMRGTGVGGGSDEREQTLNQILSEMDGFLPTEMVIVIAATNRPDVLDAALLRPGRFDRHVLVDRPTWQGRLAILKVHTRNKPLGDDVDLEAIARKTTGMTGADLRNLCNEAALVATREGKSRIDRGDFDKATDRVLVGPKREEVLTAEDKKHTAYHEAGHALCGLLVPKADPVAKVSIIPRGRALGVTRFQPDEDKLDHTEAQLLARLIVAMGGRAADRLVFNETTSGANMDLKQATRIARLMVTQFGMSDRLGPVAFRVGEEHLFLGKEIQEARDFSEGTARIIDEEVQRMLREADQRAFDLLRENRGMLDKLASALLEREELDRPEIDELLGLKPPRPEEGVEHKGVPMIVAPTPAPG
jgi:cell division protease FtsH